MHCRLSGELPQQVTVSTSGFVPSVMICAWPVACMGVSPCSVIVASMLAGRSVVYCTRSFCYLPAYTDCACHRFHRSVYPVYGMCDLRGDPGNDAIFANSYLDSRQITVKPGIGAAHHKVVLRAAGGSFGGAVPTLRQGGGSHFQMVAVAGIIPTDQDICHDIGTA